MSTADTTNAGLILLGAWCCWKTFTSPNAPPSTEEQRQYKEYKAADTMVVPVRLLTGMYQVFYYVLNFIELGPLLEYNSHIPIYQRVIGLAIIFASTALRIVCYRHMQKNFTFHLALRENHKLVTDGPYAYVRHPAYTSGCCAIVGCLLFNLGRGSWWAEWAVASRSPWLVLGAFQVAWAAIFLHGAISRCSVEDNVLREHFKEDWVQWAKKTPYRMVPYVY